jgi:hypothetical protein
LSNDVNVGGNAGMSLTGWRVSTGGEAYSASVIASTIVMLLKVTVPVDATVWEAAV